MIYLRHVTILAVLISASFILSVESFRRRLMTAKTCNSRNVCKLLPWKPWSLCSKKCGVGSKYRTRDVCMRHHSNYQTIFRICKIQKSYLHQTRSCDMGCGDKGMWSEITNKCECEDERYGDCCSLDARIWSDWTEWSNCNVQQFTVAVRLRIRTCVSKVKPGVVLRGCQGISGELKSCHRGDDANSNRANISSSRDESSQAPCIQVLSPVEPPTTIPPPTTSTTTYATTAWSESTQAATSTSEVTSSPTGSIPLCIPVVDEPMREGVIGKRNSNDDLDPEANNSKQRQERGGGAHQQNPNGGDNENEHDTRESVNQTSKSSNPKIDHSNTTSEGIDDAFNDTRSANSSDANIAESANVTTTTSEPTTTVVTPDVYDEITTSGVQTTSAESTESTTVVELPTTTSSQSSPPRSNHSEISSRYAIANGNSLDDDIVDDSPDDTSITNSPGADPLGADSAEDGTSSEVNKTAVDSTSNQESKNRVKEKEKTTQAIDYKFTTKYYFETRPENITTYTGESIMLECRIGPEYKAVRWFHNGIDMYKYGVGMLTIGQVEFRHLGRYDCMVDVEDGVTLTSSAWLKLHVSSAMDKCYIETVMTPRDTIAREGIPLWMHCTPKYSRIAQQWYKGNTKMKQTDRLERNIVNKVRVESNTLLFQVLKKSDSGIYKCELMDPQRMCTHTITFTVSTYESVSEVCGRTKLDEDNIEALSKMKHRVIGGENAVVGSAPWMVVFIDSEIEEGENREFCGGVLISDSAVLTAAHCFSRYDGDNNEMHMMALSRVRLSFGTYVRRKNHRMNNRVRKLDIEGTMDIKAGTYVNDIALVHLEEPVKFNSDVRPACLPDSQDPEHYQEMMKPGTRGVVFGYGYTNADTSHQPSILQVVTVAVQPDSECSRNSPFYNREFMFCAGDRDKTRDACYGDSGGPFLVRDANNHQRWTVTGLVSWGKGCAHKGSYGYYVLIRNRISWIDDSLEIMKRRKIVNQRSGRKQESDQSYEYEDAYYDDDDEDDDEDE